MPNWCDCELEIKGKSVDLQKLVDTVCSPHKDSKQLVLDENKIIPYPEEFKVKDDAHEKWYKEHYDVKSHTIVPDSTPQPEDGYNHGGYEWCNRHWGTKWGFCECELLKSELTENNGILRYEFDTAWSPPKPLILKLSEMFPDLKIVLRYWEGGSGFSGVARYHRGKYTEDTRNDCYNGHRGG